MSRMTIGKIRRMKEEGEKFAALTAYDYVTAKLIDEAGIPIILVGDSLGMVVLGYENTIPVRLDDIIYHTRAVVRGASRALIVADMPFMTYQKSPEQALESAGRCIQEGGAQAVKLEGGLPIAPTIEKLVASGIPVMAHIGLTPQSVHQLSGFKVQGKTTADAKRLIEDASAVEEAGAFSVVLETVPAELARLITERLLIPTIGIGAGVDCDGEIQVVSDILGWFTDFLPKHTHRYANLAEAAAEAIGHYANDVAERRFPTEENSYRIEESVLREAGRLRPDDGGASRGAPLPRPGGAGGE